MKWRKTRNWIAGRWKATVQVDLSEEYRQVLGSGPVSIGTKIRNAAVEGFADLEEGAVALVVFVFALGPSLLFWLAILVVPGWFVWKRFRLRALHWAPYSSKEHRKMVAHFQKVDVHTAIP